MLAHTLWYYVQHMEVLVGNVLPVLQWGVGVSSSHARLY